MGKWKMVQLGDVCDGVSSNIAQKDLESNEGPYPIYGASGLIKCVDFYKHGIEYIAVVKDGAGIGRTTLHPPRSSVIGTMQSIVPRTSVNSRYLYYAVSAMNLAKYYTGSTIPHIYFKDYKKEILPLPPLPVQQKIADVLDRASALIEKRKAQIDKLDLLVKSQFIEMFGDPVTNPKGWEQSSLKSVCTKLTDGTHFSPESYSSGDYLYITAKNIKHSGFDFSNITYVNEDVHNQIYNRCNPEYGDVLYIKDGVTTGIAMVNLLHEPFTMLSSVALLKQDRNVLKGEYLSALLNNDSMYMSIRNNMGGAAITRLTLSKLNSIMVVLPPLALQDQFTTFVRQVESQKSLLRQSLAKLEQNYKSLMQKCFRGEIF